MMSAIQAELFIDGNTQGLHKGEDRFYMLTLNPSNFELIRMPLK